MYSSLTQAVWLLEEGGAFRSHRVKFSILSIDSHEKARLSAKLDPLSAIQHSVSNIELPCSQTQVL